MSVGEDGVGASSARNDVARAVVGMDMAPPISGREHITSGSAKELVATVAGVQDV